MRNFLVGGFLRDLFLEEESRDLDFMIEHNAIAVARTFAREIKGAFIVLDQEHGCARVAKKHKGRVYTFDFADFRAASFKKDLLCRDFTVNTLSVDLSAWKGGPLAENCVDLCGARRDLTDGVIRMISPKAFQQDPLRLLRAFALRAKFGFSIDRATRAQMKKDRELIRDVSAERVREEIFKILESPRAGVVFKAMDRMGLLERVIPHIRVMFGIKQGGYHHLDVWPHALETLRQMEGLIKAFAKDEQMNGYLQKKIASNHSRKALLKLACLLHDAGKPETRQREGARIRFHGHEHAGKAVACGVARHLKLSTRERYALCDMVMLHLRPGYLSNFKRPSQKAFFRYFRDTREEAVSIALLAMADQRATCGPMTTEEDARHHDDICRGLIERYFNMQNEEPCVPLLTGKDLIRILKLKPAPLFSKILKEVEEAQATGKVCTKDQALDIARRFIKHQAC